jgi:Domain of unknown function (DUF4263)
MFFGESVKKQIYPDRKKTEADLRKQVSEGVMLEVHDRVFAPVQAAVNPILNAVESRFEFGSSRRTNQEHLRNLRRLLAARVKERALQDALYESGLLTNGGLCRAVQEVSTREAVSNRGYRMDLVVLSDSGAYSEVIELKRGTHLLLAHSGKANQRVAKGLKRAIQQLETYGATLKNDKSAVSNLRKNKGIPITVTNIELRLVAGRRLPRLTDYSLLNFTKGSDTEGTGGVQISTWDGLLAELERISC